jgi:hypothetical protein
METQEYWPQYPKLQSGALPKLEHTLRNFSFEQLINRVIILRRMKAMANLGS